MLSNWNCDAYIARGPEAGVDLQGVVDACAAREQLRLERQQRQEELLARWAWGLLASCGLQSTAGA